MQIRLVRLQTGIAIEGAKLIQEIDNTPIFLRLDITPSMYTMAHCLLRFGMHFRLPEYSRQWRTSAKQPQAWSNGAARD
jgi:hypothetical protein